MMKHSTRSIAAAGATTGLAIALIGGLSPLAAYAADSDIAPTEGASYDIQAQSLLDDAAVQAVGVDGEGNLVVYTTDDKDVSDHTQAFLDSTDNVKLTTVAGTFEAAATTDVVGGAGYGYPTGNGTVGLCSIGFSAWTPDGKPGFVSAGHCTDDNAAKKVYLTQPSLDEAGSGVQLTDELGALSFSQFGGPRNTTGADGDRTSIDFSAWKTSNSALTMLPEVTDWTTADSDDLSTSTETITAVGSAKLGPVERSGRTTGKTSGEVLQTSAWFRVTVPGEPDGRFVHGFITDARADRGDSGGAIWQGSTAVGVVSAVGTDTDGRSLMLGADLKDGLARSGGYTIMLKVAAPKVATTGTVASGSPISGTAPAGTKVVVKPASGAAFSATSDASGQWSFPAPQTVGTYDFTVVAKNGFNVSAATAGSVTVTPAAPVITAPTAGGTAEGSVNKITGTGSAGATVKLGDGASGEAVVGDDGTWSVAVELTIGDHRVTARQSIGGLTSATTAVAFAVVPGAPVITAPTGETDLLERALPRAITGTGLDGAEVQVSVDGASVGTATVSNGVWKLPFPADLGPGMHNLTATQSVNGKTSAATTVELFVAPSMTNPNAPSQPSAPSDPKPEAPDSSDDLAATGASDATPAILGGVGLLIAGAIAVVISRRRLVRD